MKNLHYGWKTVFFSFFILATNALGVFGFGVFLKPLTEEFGWDRSLISGAFSLGSIATGLVSLFAGRLGDRFGPRFFTITAGILLSAGFMLMSRVESIWHVYAIWGLLIGAGVGFSGTPIISAIPRWFSKKRGIALAITVAGFNFGALIGPIIIQSLISSYGWRNAFFLVGFLPLLVNLPLSIFLRKSPEMLGLKPYGEGEEADSSKQIKYVTQEITFASAMKTGRFWLFGFLQFSFGFCMQTVIVHVAPHATDIGIPVIIAASILSISGGSRIIGNLTTGILSESLGGRKLLTVCFAILTLSFIWLIFTRDTAGFFVFAILFGIASGGVIPLLTLVPAELFGLRSLGAVSGAFLLMGTMGGAIGSPFAGYIFDTTGDYRSAFAFSIGIGAVAIILSLFLIKIKLKH